jgi:AcrR family transcriptional regulator
VSRARIVQSRSKAAVDAITSAARDCFVRDGYEAATVDGIAERAGRTKGAVYHHFADKRALFHHVFLAEQRTVADLVVAAAAHDDPVESLARGLRAYLDLIAGSPDSAELTLVQAPRVLGWEEWRSCDGGPFRALLAASITAIADARRLRSPIDGAVLAELLLGAVTESALCVISAVDPPDVATRHAAAIGSVVADLTT